MVVMVSSTTPKNLHALFCAEMQCVRIATFLFQARMFKERMKLKAVDRAGINQNLCTMSGTHFMIAIRSPGTIDQRSDVLIFQIFLDCLQLVYWKSLQESTLLLHSQIGCRLAVLGAPWTVLGVCLQRELFCTYSIIIWLMTTRVSFIAQSSFIHPWFQAVAFIIFVYQSVLAVQKFTNISTVLSVETVDIGKM